MLLENLDRRLASFPSVLRTSKRMMALITIYGSNPVVFPTPRHTWVEHPVAEDLFLEKAMNEPAEVSPAFEYLSSGSSSSEAPLAG